jgi:predicted transcriptional regulator
LAKAEIAKMGLSEFARRMRINTSNLAKIIAGRRPMTQRMTKLLKGEIAVRWHLVDNQNYPRLDSEGNCAVS